MPTRQHYWSLIREFTVSGFKLRDQGSLLGFLWTLLHPLALLAVLYFLFQFRLGNETPFFRVYLLIGIIHWSFFSTATTKTVTSIGRRDHLVLNINFPREILVISDVGSVLISFVLELVVLLVFLVVEGVPFHLTWFLLPAVIGLQALLILGVGLALASLQVFVRDVERIWTIVLRIGFFLVPIFYEASIIESDFQRRVFLCNPLAQIMQFSRSVLIEGVVPSPGWVLYTLLFGGVLLGGAMVFFKRLEPRFAERL